MKPTRWTPSYQHHRAARELWKFCWAGGGGGGLLIDVLRGFTLANQTHVDIEITYPIGILSAGQC
jgi:hypothetical protein